MAKDTFYFSHDYNSRNDEKIKSLIFKHGLRGYGIFWAIIEDLYNNTNELQTNYERIAFELREDLIIVKSVIEDFELFVISDNYFGSNSVQKRLDERAEKSKKAKESVKLRWQKHQENKDIDTNVLPTHNDSNTIKERKGKEIKEKESKVKEIKEIKLNKVSDESLQKQSFKNWTLEDFENDIKLHRAAVNFTKDQFMSFYEYWKELAPSGKMKFQMQKTWQTDLRLKYWAKNDFNWNKPNQTVQEKTLNKMEDAFEKYVEGVYSGKY